MRTQNRLRLHLRLRRKTISRNETSTPFLAAAARTAAALAVLLLAWAFCLLKPDGAGAATRPNFVLIQLDDLTNLHLDGKWIDSFGATRRSMPLTHQELIDQGVRFTRYITPNPICSPSRAALLSGRYQENNGVVRNGGATGGWTGYRNNRIHDENLATWLRSAGYRTMFYGKFLNGYAEPDGYPSTYVPPGWEVWQANVNAEPARDFYGYFLNVNSQIEGPFGPLSYGPGMEKDPEGCPDLGLAACNYHTDAITTRAINDIEATPADRPLLAKVAFQTPHGDFWPPSGPEPAVRHYDSALQTPRPNPLGYDERDVSDKPPWIRSRSRLGSQAVTRLRVTYQKAIESLRSVDESVSRIIAALRNSGRLDNTYIFFFSDNGLFLGEHRINTGKSHPYEPALRVPMIVRGPGVPKGKASTELVANHDVAPTVLSLAGAVSGSPVDGRPMTPFWKRPAKLSRRPILLSSFTDLSDGRFPPGGDPFYRGLRVGPYKFVRYHTGFRELYDLSRDPGELDNRASDPRYRKVATYMNRQLRKYQSCSGAECRAPVPRWPAPKLR